MTSRISRRALVVTVVGVLLLVGGAVFVSQGLAQRYVGAHSSLTVHQQPHPNDLNEYTYYSFSGGNGLTIDDNITYIMDDIVALTLADAEASGSFQVPHLDVYVQEHGVVAVSGEMPNFWKLASGGVARPWAPHAYMIPAFAGGTVTFAGLFWLATRWHLTASAHRREIDETPL
ncbi:hypothetical protein [Microbacterium sp. MPKO10]|uniref:hypothetical protein n=1 Tax=Microbacterium sp. MPKO10 TaxID=2989818 RepID=UPI0022359A18|nr:hypothetical protein [Microbacterium sp. MPKO10]MCW4456800.1 hypothetical protein [Microbacterium sp. MPKO10]